MPEWILDACYVQNFIPFVRRAWAIPDLKQAAAKMVSVNEDLSSLNKTLLLKRIPTQVAQQNAVGNKKVKSSWFYPGDFFAGVPCCKYGNSGTKTS